MSDSTRFIGRQKEQEQLALLLKKKTASLVVIKGRRRIGKSRLVEEFAKGMTFYHFSGLPPEEKTTAQDQRDEFAQSLSTQTGLPVLPFQDWHQIFVLLAEKITSGRVIVLFDEISWMGSHDPNFLGKLKNAWDMYYKKNPKLILVLCGSVSQWIEKNILSSTGFFGRIAQEITLDELPLADAATMLDAVGFKGTSHEKLMLLGVTGGVPWYLENIYPKMSAVENIKRLCFEKNGLLVKEYDKIFHDLFSSRGTTSKNIVSSLVYGPKEYEEISAEINYPSGGPLSHYLDELVTSGFIAKDSCWSLKTGKTLKLYKYRLRDNYLRFYLRYIATKKGKIDKGQYSNLSIASLPEWESIMGLQFENLVLNNRDLIQHALNIDPADIIDDNPYFQHKTVRQQGCQIDYLIQTKYNTVYAGEVKFSQKALGINVIDEMEQKVQRLSLPRGFVCHPVLIHIGPLSESLQESDYFFHTIDFSSYLNPT
jgi:AAA+ ATPase superfamily predicted ATPase